VVDTGGLLQADRWIIGSGQSVQINGAAQGDVSAAGLGTLVHGSGDIFGDLSLTGGAELNPGNSPGTLDVFGDVLLDDGALLASEITGFGAGEFDRLNIFGDLVLGSTGAGARWTFDFTGFTADPVAHLNEALTVFTLDDLLDSNGDPVLDAAGNPVGTGAIDGWFSVIDFIGLDGFTLAYEPGSALQGSMALGNNGLTGLMLLRIDDGSQTRFDLVFTTPAPATSGLLLIGLVSLAGLRQRRRAGAAPTAVWAAPL